MSYIDDIARRIDQERALAQQKKLQQAQQEQAKQAAALAKARKEATENNILW